MPSSIRLSAFPATAFCRARKESRQVRERQAWSANGCHRSCFPPYFRPGSRRSTGLEIDHQVYSDCDGIWNCSCAFRMDEVLKTGLNDQPWSDRAPVCPLDGGFEISHGYGQARGIAGLFHLAETRGVRAIRESHRREIFGSAGHHTICHQPGIEEIWRRIQALAVSLR